MEELLRQAIRERRLIEFFLQGFLRVAEPHLHGTHGRARHMLVYQVRGGSRSGGLPFWRRVDLAEVSGLRLLDERFEAIRLDSHRPSGWDEILAIVQ